MPSHRLILVKAPKAGEWLVEWDATTLSVTAPDGQPVFQMPVDRAHRVVDLHDLDADYKVNFTTDAGDLRFKRNKPAARDVRELVQKGLRCDVEWRQTLRHQSRRAILVGLFLFIVCGGLFSLYCWWASWAPDPPDGSWFYYVARLIRPALIILAGLALAGPGMVIRSLRQLSRIRRVERDGAG
jgi:hypothetical protein